MGQAGSAGLAIDFDRLPIRISANVADNIDRVLTAIRMHLRMDVAFVSEFLGSSRVFRSVDLNQRINGVEVGAIMPMANGYCQHVVEGRLPELIPDTAALPLAMSIPETNELPIGAHLSVPIRLGDGQIYGTFCCFSHRAMPELGMPELELMHTFSRMIARELAHDVDRNALQYDRILALQGAMRAGDPQMVFQPVFQISDGAMVGVEALSRFASLPRRSPDQWFAEAAELGMGAALETLAMRRAIELCHDLPPHLSININVSPATLQSEDLTLNLRGVDPHRVVLEVTEHEPVADYAALIRALRPLREMGVRVAIDDAGAGYSSLRHVLMMQPEIVKLDVSLTRGIDADPVRQAMAAALGEFAGRTSTVVVAEGVETEAELAKLRDLGIDQAQGYLLGRPQPLYELFSKMPG